MDDTSNKFGEVFDSINKNIVGMSNALVGISKTENSTLEIQKNIGDTLVETVSDNKRREELAEVTEKSNTKPESKSQEIFADVAVGNLMADIAVSLKGMLFGGGIFKKIFTGASLIAIVPVLSSIATGLIDGLFSSDVGGSLKTLFDDKIDMDKVKDNSTAIGAGAVSFLARGPVGVIGTVITESLLSGFENITGVDIPDNQRMIYDTLGGIFGFKIASGMTKNAIKTLVSRAVIGGSLSGSLGVIMGAITNPVFLALAGIGGAMVGLDYLFKKAAEKRQQQNFEVIDEALKSDDPNKMIRAVDLVNHEYDPVSGLAVDNTTQKGIDEKRQALVEKLTGKLEQLKIDPEWSKDEIIKFFTEKMNVQKLMANSDEELKKVYADTFDDAMNAGLSLDDLRALPIRDDPNGIIAYENLKNTRQNIQKSMKNGVQSLIELTTNLYNQAMANQLGMKLEDLQIPPSEIRRVDELQGLPGNTKVKFGPSGAILRENSIVENITKRLSRLEAISKPSAQAPIAVVNSGNVYNAPDNRNTNVVSGGGAGGVSGHNTQITYSSSHLKGNPTSRMH